MVEAISGLSSYWIGNFSFSNFNTRGEREREGKQRRNCIWIVFFVVFCCFCYFFVVFVVFVVFVFAIIVIDFETFPSQTSRGEEEKEGKRCKNYIFRFRQYGHETIQPILYPWEVSWYGWFWNKLKPDIKVSRMKVFFLCMQEVFARFYERWG